MNSLGHPLVNLLRGTFRELFLWPVSWRSLSEHQRYVNYYAVCEEWVTSMSLIA